MKTSLRSAGMLGAALICVALAQTQLDVRTQTRNIDFSNAAATRPARMGSALPGTCGTGEMFFQTTAQPGENIYLCTAANTWSPAASNITGVLPVETILTLPATCLTGDTRYVTDASFSAGGWRLYICTAANTWTQAAVQADGSGYLTVNCAAPGNCLAGVNTAVVPSLTGPNPWTGANDFSAASKTAPFRIAAEAPETCDAGARETYLHTGTNTLHLCTATDTWTAVASPQHSRILYRNSNIAPLAANGSAQTLDSFVIPAGTLQVGDVIEIQANFSRTGSAGGITFGVSFGGGAVPPVATPVSSARAFYAPSLTVSGMEQQVWGGMLSADGTVTAIGGSATADIASPVTVSLTQNGTAPDTGAVSSWYVKVTR